MESNTVNIETTSRAWINLNRVTMKPTNNEMPTTTTEFIYPDAWKDKMPIFPFVPSKDDVTLAPYEKVPKTVKSTLLPTFPFDKKTNYKLRYFVK